MAIRVLEGGLQTTVQGLRRQGLRHQGVPWAGAADPLSLMLANRLVGNKSHAPALEITYGPFRAQFTEASQIALTGAPMSAMLGGHSVVHHQTIDVVAGNELILTPSRTGARTYLSVDGGIEVPKFMGSASTYLPAAFGGFHGRVLGAGDLLDIRAASPVTTPLSTPRVLQPFMGHDWVLRVCRGAEAGRVIGSSWQEFLTSSWTVSRRSDRIGCLLEGEPLQLTDAGVMKSAPVFPGTVQCPPDGQPFLLGIDAQTTGGYLRIAHVIRPDRHRIGQLRPGDRVRFQEVTPRESTAVLREKISRLSQWLGPVVLY
ncbi:MAG: biotin-dependent carboxyltransferase family protein [Pseudomonadota bacterium]